MSSSKSTLRLIGAFAVLATLALAISCKGFFVNQPTSVTITPNSPTLTSGTTQAFIATAAFSDNNSKVITTSATWTTSNSCVVAIVGSGANAGNATDVGTGGSATITASYNGVVGTATASVTSGLTITPCPTKVVGSYPEVVFTNGTSTTFAASGATGTVTWTVDPPSNAATINVNTGVATFGPQTGTATLKATDSAGSNPGTLYITVQ